MFTIIIAIVAIYFIMQVGGAIAFLIAAYLTKLFGSK